MKKRNILILNTVLALSACESRDTPKVTYVDTIDYDVTILFNDEIKNMVVDSREDFEFGHNSGFVKFKDKNTGEIVYITVGTPAIIVPTNRKVSHTP